MPINYKHYPPNWKSEIVPSILKRANYCCENCNRKQGQEVRSYIVPCRRKGKLVYRNEWDNQPDWNEGGRIVTVILTVAHLDNDHYNWLVKPERLKALCQLCHLRLDASFKAQKRKAKRKTLRGKNDQLRNFQSQTNLFQEQEVSTTTAPPLAHHVSTMEEAHHHHSPTTSTPREHNGGSTPPP